MTKVNDFDALSKNAKWLLCHILAGVDDDAWVHTEDAPDFDIRVNGRQLEDIDYWLEGVMQVFMQEVRLEAAELVMEHFGELRNAYDMAFEDAKVALMEHIGKKFGVNLFQEEDK